MHKHWWDFKKQTFRCTCGACVGVELRELGGFVHLDLRVRAVGAGVSPTELYDLAEFLGETAAEAHRLLHHGPLPKRYRKRGVR